ncbi:MAG: Ig-like domain-containing protein, partial [Myxococcota bacterium]
MNTPGRFLLGFPTWVLLIFMIGCGSTDDLGGDLGTPGDGQGDNGGGSGGDGFQDIIAPVVRIQSPSDGVIVPPGTVTLTGTAQDQNGIERVEVEFRDSDPELADGLEDWTYRTPELAVGTYTFFARAFDPAGNASVAQLTVLVQEGATDTEAPTLSITSPAESSVLAAGFITVRGTASDNVGVESVFGKLDLSGENATAVGTEEWELVLDASALTTGEHLLIISARDRAGNVSAAALRSITIDRSLPVAEILSAPASVTSSDRAVFTIGGLNVVSY